MKIGDIAEVVLGHNIGTEYIFNLCPWTNEEVSYGDIVVVIGQTDFDCDLPTRYKVRNTENDKTFYITYDKLKLINYAETSDYGMELTE